MAALFERRKNLVNRSMGACFVMQICWQITIKTTIIVQREVLNVVAASDTFGDKMFLFILEINVFAEFLFL